jgi:molybdate/tungstate transport system permease protein
VSLIVIVLAGLHIVLSRWLDPGVNLVLASSNLAVALLGLRHARTLPAGRFALFPAGYLFLLVVVWLGGGAPLVFGLLALVFAAAFGTPVVAGVVLLFGACFYLLTPYAVPAFLLLTLLWLGVAAAGRRDPFLAWAYGIGFVLMILALLPILSLVFTSSTQTLLEQAGGMAFRSAVLLSLVTASISTVVVLALGVPLAYAMVRLRFPGRRLLDAAIDIPILVPQSVAGIALLLLFGPKVPLGRALSSLGVDVTGSIVGIVVAQVFVSSPFLVRSAMNAFAAIPEATEMTARSLGATRTSTFVRVVLPLASAGILDGSVLCWSRAISEVGTLMVLAYHPMTAPIFIYDVFTQYGLAEAQPAAAVLVILCLWVFLLLRWLWSPPGAAKTRWAS